MDHVSVEVWLERQQMKALEAVLGERGDSVENALQEYLNGMYSELVPLERQQEISAAIEAEAAATEQRLQANRRFGVFRITENGHTTCMESEQSKSPLNTAWNARLYLKWKSELMTDQRTFVAKMAPVTGISEQDFAERLAEFQTGDQRVQGVFDLDFDQDQFSFWDRSGEQHAYSMKDACVAAYRAFRKEHRPDAERQEIFDCYLARREVQPAEQAQDEDFSPQMSQF